MPTFGQNMSWTSWTNSYTHDNTILDAEVDRNSFWTNIPIMNDNVLINYQYVVDKLSTYVYCL